VELPTEAAAYATFTYQVTQLEAEPTIAPYISTRFDEVNNDFEITGDANAVVSWTVYAK